MQIVTSVEEEKNEMYHDNSMMQRTYLVKSRSLKPKMAESVATRIEDEFVKRRKEITETKIDEEWLSRRVELTRLIAKSYGRDAIQVEDWEESCSLIDRISERILALK